MYFKVDVNAPSPFAWWQNFLGSIKESMKMPELLNTAITLLVGLGRVFSTFELV